MIVTIPMRLPSAANLREHWRVRHRRVKDQRATTRIFLGAKRGWLPVVVTLTRVAPKSLDDDNLAGAFKGIRDEVAAWLGVDDADPRVSWRYAQRRGAVREYAIMIELAHPVGME